MKNKIITILVIAAVCAAAAAGALYMQRKNASSEADSVLTTMKQLIPGLGVETGIQAGDGKDPLPVITLNDIDIVGCLEIPSIDLMAPVKAKGENKGGFITYKSGSAVKGKLFLYGSRNDVFAGLAKVKPGDRAAFTDVDGVRYLYSVLTQFHLKKWDEADYDLMLYYNTDSKTRFVVGLNRDPN